MAYQPLFNASGKPVFDASGRIVWATVRAGALHFTLSLATRSNYVGSYSAPTGTGSVSVSLSLERSSYGVFAAWSGPQVSTEYLGQDSRGEDCYLVSAIRYVSVSYAGGGIHTISATYTAIHNNNGSLTSGIGGSVGRSYTLSGYFPDGSYVITASASNILGRFALVNADCLGSLSASFS